MGNDSGLINRSSILIGNLGLPIHSYETAPVVMSLVIPISAYFTFGLSILGCWLSAIFYCFDNAVTMAGIVSPWLSTPAGNFLQPPFPIEGG